MTSNIFGMRQASWFLDYPKQPFFRMFLVFLMRERPILTVLKQMISDEIKQSNSIKPPKNQLYHDFFKVSS